MVGMGEGDWAAALHVLALLIPLKIQPHSSFLSNRDFILIKQFQYNNDGNARDSYHFSSHFMKIWRFVTNSPPLHPTGSNKGKEYACVWRKEEGLQLISLW